MVVQRIMMIICKYCRLPISPKEAYNLLFNVGWYHCQGHVDQHAQALTNMVKAIFESLKKTENRYKSERDDIGDADCRTSKCGVIQTEDPNLLTRYVHKCQDK